MRRRSAWRQGLAWATGRLGCGSHGERAGRGGEEAARLGRQEEEQIIWDEMECSLGCACKRRSGDSNHSFSHMVGSLLFARIYSTCLGCFRERDRESKTENFYFSYNVYSEAWEIINNKCSVMYLIIC